MASMGSLGHYMQETSRDGFNLRDFLHEGNGDIWLAALDGPRPYAGWLLIEEKAEGGDMLAKRARENPEFLLLAERPFWFGEPRSAVTDLDAFCCF